MTYKGTQKEILRLTVGKQRIPRLSIRLLPHSLSLDSNKFMEFLEGSDKFKLSHELKNR